MDALVEKLLKESATICLNIDLTKVNIEPTALEAVDQDLALQFDILPYDIKGDKIQLFSDYNNQKRIQLIQDRLTHAVEFIWAKEEDIHTAILHHYRLSEKYKQIERKSTADQNYDSDASVQVNSMIKSAIHHGASDIHIEPMDARVRIRFRIDGDLEDVSERFPIDFENRDNINRYIKQHADPPLKGEVKGMTQSGRMTYPKNDRTDIDIRISCKPTIRGEAIVLRIQDNLKGLADVGELGFDEEEIALLESALLETKGFILVVGQTGSGKSTSIYSFIIRLNKPKLKIITIEDPVEIKVDGLEQIQVHETNDEDTNLTFAKILREVLRSDPNIIFVGEMRDNETARIAVKGSQTGHLVFSTLHASSVIGAFPRLGEMDINVNSFIGEMNCLIAQRLPKKNCPHCSAPYDPTEEAKGFLTPEELDFIKQGTPKKGDGCQECLRRGTKGRTVLAEILLFDKEIRSYLLKNYQDQTVAEDWLIKNKGFRTMRMRALILVQKGIISVQEMKSQLGRLS